MIHQGNFPADIKHLLKIKKLAQERLKTEAVMPKHGWPHGGHIPNNC
jgi:hypothetical protein